MKANRSHLKVILILITLVSLIISMGFSPSSAYWISEYRVPAAAAELQDPRPLNIILSTNGSNVFFTEELAGRIGAMNTVGIGGDGRKFIEYIIPVDPILGYSEPWDLTNATNNLIFFTDYHQSRIWMLDTATSPTLRYWDTPTPGSGPRGIYVMAGTTGSSGTIWFTEFLKDKIACLDLATDTFTEYALPVGSGPNSILVSKNCVYWTEYNTHRIGRLNFTASPTPQIIYFQLSSGSRPWDLTVDPDGMIWFTASGTSINSIGKLNPHTGFTIEYRSIPTGSCEPRGIKIDNSTRNVWFTEFAGHKVTKYVPGSNIFFEYPTLTPSSAPADIVLRTVSASPQRTEAYFTEWSGNRIGLIVEGTEVAAYGTTSTITATKITSAVTQSYLAGTTSQTYAKGEATKADQAADAPVKRIYAAASTNGTTTILPNTSYKLSTSTMGTSTSFITEVIYTTSTSTSVSTSYISTESRTSTSVSLSVSTSYTGTTSVTYTTTSFETLYTSTLSLTSTSTISVPQTLVTTLYSTKYKSTTSGLTSTTVTQTAQAFKTLTSYTTVLATAPTTVTVTTNTTVAPRLPWTCVIASAAYGSELSPAVQRLRDFRDRLVLSTYAGSSFMESFNAWYYSFSPTVAGWVSASPSARAAVRAFLYPLLAILQVSSSTFRLLSFSPETGIVAAGIVASGLIGLVYDAPIMTLALIKLRRRFGFRLTLRSLTPFYLAIMASLVMISVAEAVSSTLLMRFSTSVLVLSVMIGAAASASVLSADRISKLMRA